MAEKQTVTGQFRWDTERCFWLPATPKREADTLVLNHLRPDEQGISGWLEIEALLEELPPRYRGRINGNGSNMFNKGRGLGRDFIFDASGKRYRNSLVKVRSIGLVPQVERYQRIRSDLAQQIRTFPCAVLLTHQEVEVDHKSGRKDDRRLENPALQMLADFQPLNKGVNAVKRSHCTECLRTGRRFDARRLGFSSGWWLGGEAERTCNGCYWHDPQRFNAEMSRGFHPDNAEKE